MTETESNMMSKRLVVLSFLQFSVWGAYLTSVGIYLFKVGLGDRIGWFFSVQGLASIFMPALAGFIADKWVPAQKLLSFCHFVSAFFMFVVGYTGMVKGENVLFNDLFLPYMFGISFYMPTIALSNSVSYSVLNRIGQDAVSVFPRIRVFGTVGFVFFMWFSDIFGFKDSYSQFFLSAVLGVMVSCYSLSLPSCPVCRASAGGRFCGIAIADVLKCFADRRMLLFFLFAMLMGGALQISNGFVGAYLGSFAGDTRYAEAFAVKYPVVMTSLSQISEMLCLLLVPYFFVRLGIKKIMIVAMVAWAMRFYFLAVGNPGEKVIFFVLSMFIYGVAFDFFNISGSLFVNRETDGTLRSSAQGLFMLVSNGLGASVGMLFAQAVVDYSLAAGGWSQAWYMFSAYVAVVCLLFCIFFKE